MPLPSNDKYMVVADPASQGRWRLQNIKSKNLVGPSYSRLDVAQAAMRRRNKPEGAPDR